MSTLIGLFHHRWGVPVLAELHRTKGSRFVTLANRLGLAGESLRRTLAALIDAGLVARNPGYGHPLRPEYVLTPAGRRVAPACAELVDALHELDLLAVGLKKWSMPTVYALRNGTRRFSELRAELAVVSPRALALALKDLEGSGLVARQVLESYPPSTVYALTPTGTPLAGVVGTLAR